MNRLRERQEKGRRVCRTAEQNHLGTTSGRGLIYLLQVKVGDLFRDLAIGRGKLKQRDVKVALVTRPSADVSGCVVA